MSPKWRPQTRPILGQQLGNMLDRIEELERASASKAGAGGYGGGAGPGQIAEKIQAGQATTGVDGKVTVTSYGFRSGSDRLGLSQQFRIGSACRSGRIYQPNSMRDLSRQDRQSRSRSRRKMDWPRRSPRSQPRKLRSRSSRSCARNLCSRSS